MQGEQNSRSGIMGRILRSSSSLKKKDSLLSSFKMAIM